MNFYKFFTLSLIFFASFYSVAKKNNNEIYIVEIVVFEQLEIIGNEELESQKLRIEGINLSLIHISEQTRQEAITNAVF